MNPQQNFGKHAVSMRIGRLIMQETGTYNPHFQRSYQTYMDGDILNGITRRIDEFGSGKITGSLLSGVVGNVITPSPTPQGEIYIPNGWSEKRIRFLLELHCDYNIGTQMVYYLQGYTTYPGVTNTGHVAPDMEFVVNSLIGVTRVNQVTPLGIIAKDMISESSQVLSDPNWQSPSQGNSMFMMRPQDIFRGMQTQYMQSSYAGADVSHFDARSMLRREATRSSRVNNLPTNYVAKVIDGYCVGTDLAAYGQSDKDIVAASVEHVFETPLAENPFIRFISDRKGMGITNRFYFGDLEILDPNVSNVTNYTVTGQTQLTQVHHAGQTAYWNASDRETVVATVLSHAIPALMMELMISKVTFRSTNHDIGGNINTVIIDAKSLTNADLTRNFEIFKQRFEREVLFDITFGNQEPILLEMTVDLFGETWISISLGNSPMCQYCTASFCDNLLVPVIAGNKNMYDTVVSDFDHLVNAVTDSLGTRQHSTAINNLV